MSMTKCDTLGEYFIVKRALLEKGLIYVENNNNPPIAGVNYVRQDGWFFSTCSEHEYKQYHETK